MDMNTPLTKKQQKNLENKQMPKPRTQYLVTDSCFWDTNPPQDYNVFDPKRKPHAIELVDTETGTVVLLKSGSIIEVIAPKL